MRSGGEASRDVVGDVGVEKSVELMRDWPGSGGDFVTVDLAHADKIAIGRRNKNFVGEIEVFRSKRFLRRCSVAERTLSNSERSTARTRSATASTIFGSLR